MKPHFFSPTLANIKATPIIKWAGGKNALLPQFAPYFPDSFRYSRYIEPFLGGGAVFFHLQPTQSFLLDLNAQLIEVYQVVRDNVEALITSLHQHRNEREYYYTVRAQATTELSPVERASRFIFLNRTCYNGLYRVNRKGQFNVPFGSYKNPNICDEDNLRAAHSALQTAHLQVGDFEVVLTIAQPNDLIYFDPPYEPISPTSSFTGYTSTGFTSDDQRRLARTFHQLNDMGCLLMLSNSNAPLVYDLYKGFRIHEISARRMINSKADGRGAITELLITNL